MRLKLLFYIGLMFPMEILAQQITDTSSFTIQLKEMVISANKVEEDKRQVAQQIETIPAREIQQLNTNSTADLLQYSGQLFVQKSQMGGGSPVIRGFEASRVLLMIDGVRQNNLIYRAGHLQNVITFDQQMLERVEINFGPSSTIYGSDALGGVISMYTRNPRLSSNDGVSASGNIFARFSSANMEKTGHADVQISGGKFASLTSFTYSDFDDLRMGKQPNPFYKKSFGLRPYYAARINGKDSLVPQADPYVQKFSGYEQTDLLQKFLYQPNEHFRHIVNLQYSTSSNIPRYDRLTDPKNRKDPLNPGLNSAEWYYGPQERLMTAYHFTYRHAEKFFSRVQITASYQTLTESRHNRNFGSANLNHRTENVDVAGLTVDAQHKVNKHDLRIGFDGQYNTLLSRAYREVITSGSTQALDTRYPDGSNTQSNLAVYASHTMKTNEKFIVSDGLRVSKIDLKSSFVNQSFFPFPFQDVKQEHYALSGNIGLVWLPSDPWKISYTVSTGFRSPNVDDLSKVFESQPGILFVPNSGIKPEKTITNDLQITRVFGNRFRWENVFFYTLFYDAIVSDRFTFNGSDSIFYDGTMSAVFANQNKKEAYLYGFNSIMQFDITQRFITYGSVAYTYGRIQTDSTAYPLDHIPPLYGKAGLRYADKKLNAEFFMLFNGWKKIKDYNITGEDNAQYAPPEGTPAWYTLHVRVGIPVWKGILIQAGVDNLLDIQYRTFSSGINAPGRNITGTLRYSF